MRTSAFLCLVALATSGCALKTADIAGMPVAISMPMVPSKAKEPLTVVVPDMPAEIVVREDGLYPGKVLNISAFAAEHLPEALGEVFADVRTASDAASVSEGLVLKVEILDLGYPKQSASSGGFTATQFRAKMSWRAALYRADSPDEFLFTYAGEGISPNGYGLKTDTPVAWETALEAALVAFMGEFLSAGTTPSPK